MRAPKFKVLLLEHGCVPPITKSHQPNTDLTQKHKIDPTHRTRTPKASNPQCEDLTIQLKRTKPRSNRSDTQQPKIKYKKRNKWHCNGSHTFLRRPEVPGFCPSMGLVSCLTILNCTMAMADWLWRRTKEGREREGERDNNQAREKNPCSKKVV